MKHKVGFLCVYPFHYYIFNNLEPYLENPEYIIIDKSGLFQKNEDTRIKYALEKLLRDKKADYVHYTEQIDNFFNKYDILLSPYWLGYNHDFLTTNAKHVRLPHGQGKDRWSFSSWNACYDLVLTFGQYTQERLSPICNAKTVGIPKYDNYFKKEIDLEQISTLKARLDNKKETVLYLPTWSSLSSIDAYKGSISDLANDFNVVVKLHAASYYLEPDSVSGFDERLLILDDSIDPSALFSVSDYVLGDYSGAIYEAMLARKPVLLLNVDLSSDFKDQRSPDWFITKQGISTLIRDSIPSIDNGSELLDALKDLIINKDNILTKQKKVVDYLYLNNDGFSSKRAVDEMFSLLKDDYQIDTHKVSLKSYIKNLLISENNLKNKLAQKNDRIKVLSEQKTDIITQNKILKKKLKNIRTSNTSKVGSIINKTVNLPRKILSRTKRQLKL